MRTFFPALLVAFGFAAAAPCANAQTYRAERPYRGLFAQGQQDLEQSLSVSGSAGAGFDKNLADGLRGPGFATSDLNSNVRSGVAQASGSINYLLNLNAFTLNASGSTAVHYYPSMSSHLLRHNYADVGATAQVTRDLTVNGSMEYAPYGLSSLFPFTSPALPGGGVNPSVDLTSSLEHYFTYGGGVDYNHHVSKRAAFYADYLVQVRGQTTFSEPYRRQRVGGGYTYTLSKGMALRAGYHFDDADYGLSNRRFHYHQIDAGIDYNRALSFSRRTTLTFHTGTAAVSNADNPVSQFQYTLTGGARLNHEFGRTWNADVGYERGVNVDPTWANLVRSDAASASVAGLISRRLNFSATARAATGNVGGTSTVNNDFETYYGDATLNYALGRHVNVGANYVYYRHRFDQDVLIPIDFANTYNRHAIRAYVSVWAPLVQRARRTHAAR